MIDDDTSLITSEIIDSMGVLTLIGFLEEEFGVEINADDVDLSHFENVAGISPPRRGTPVTEPEFESTLRSLEAAARPPKGHGPLVAGTGRIMGQTGGALFAAHRDRVVGRDPLGHGERMDAAPGQFARLPRDRCSQDRNHLAPPQPAGAS